MEYFDYVRYQDRFLEAKDDYNNAKIIIIGAPMDFTVSFRPGTRFGPKKIREVSYGLESYSVYTDDSLEDKKFFDAGDADIPFGNVEKSLDILENITEKILEDEKIPLYLGGEHLISYPIIKKVTEKYPDLVVLHFDAHADLRDTYFGEKLSHATVLRRISEHIKDKHIFHFGIRSGVREEFLYAQQHTHMHPIEVKTPFLNVLQDLKNRPIYITLDIDVVDPAFAPGTGTPEPGGCNSQEILEVVSHFKSLNVVGFDLVEVSPANDLSDRTSLLAAKILRELLIGLG
ncbi:agmatinase [Tepidanaerobacter acetatoxydans Re1]|uniref:Agmatinase n=1 Tax=Tepidanaerobacter acetatoxydans (strain DSM 21804 / JCM 16047 / Re1) TaxID=1209989 RepID=F4LUW8_TEPAE|nr:agmatinase [Tepidanaerobacter acetatoxydans]AEE91494.1 agmatinase [Tepidanaerobacter acetatoxydans Re1]CDI40700.1 agmatinase [Tepidanaerobacter acetatoxydans Re1]